ncbi:class I SAM-dependent methyltransferase [Fodinibius salsisoli]|uniref:Class I SAM-dependent methyltransferase n=1 Tax=Fodinibius salsisoli TaxID=2820877 RepID=A0ABT3PLR1_9BACT|nr:class I SAM-dependent methyltransferase [Fodinibius salsisoli]MCW9706847.1 class I SAM-dependent methyltransferase [Fodinibius salsisoli]
MDNEKIRLEGISETLLIPLMGRALATKSRDGVLSDEKSLEIFESLNYDFDKFNDAHSRRSMMRTTIRTAIIDRVVQNHLADHPEGTVVEIGCGLNSRFERLRPANIKWFDLDVPQVHKVWKQHFEETDRRAFLPFSAFDEQWITEAKKGGEGPFLFISEASVIYFPKQKVRQLFQLLGTHFPGSYYLFDTAQPDFIESLTKNEDALKFCNAQIKWSINDVEELKEWVPTIEILNTIDLESSDHEYGALYPDDFQQAAEGYQLNLIRL